MTHHDDRPDTPREEENPLPDATAVDESPGPDAPIDEFDALLPPLEFTEEKRCH